jgi:hypothetical protein
MNYHVLIKFLHLFYYKEMSDVEPKIIRKKTKTISDINSITPLNTDVKSRPIQNLMYGEFNYLGHENTVYRFKTMENFVTAKILISKSRQCLPI